MADQDKPQYVPVDLNNLAVLPEGEVSQLDPTKGDAFESIPPPNAGPYNLRLGLGSQGVQLGYRETEPGPTGEPHGKPGTEYYRVNIECRVVAPGTDADNYPCFPPRS